jgi:hypothetical protein
MGTILPLVVTLPLLAACGSSDVSSKSRYITEKNLKSGEVGTKEAVFTAALTPLEDMGLRKRKIPDMLKMLAENPYTPPDTTECDELKREMSDLTVLLGPDMDTPTVALSAQEQALETGGNLVEDAVVGFVRSQTSVVPFRSIVRRLTGAQSHEKKVQKAVQAGQLRRAYIRGLADGKYGIACIPKVKIITSAENAPPMTEQVPTPAGTGVATPETVAKVVAAKQAADIAREANAKKE